MIQTTPTNEVEEIGNPFSLEPRRPSEALSAPRGKEDSSEKEKCIIKHLKILQDHSLSIAAEILQTTLGICEPWSETVSRLSPSHLGLHIKNQ